MRHRFRHRHGPPPFVRKMGCAFAAMIVLAAMGASTLVSIVTRTPQRALTAGLIAFAVIATLALGFRFAMRGATDVFREQDRQRRQLMADVAHELRTPLAILQGRIEGLIDGVYPRDDERLKQLLDETQHLSRLVEDLRTLSNAEAGALDLQKERVDAEELLRDAAQSFGANVDITGELPLIDVDPVRIREVLLNVLSNATRHGRTTLRAAMDGHRLVIRVIDDGPGISPDELPRIFERFHKGRDSRGSGLGLAIARKLVLAHDGTIDAASEVGKGTTVTIALPV